MATPGISTKPQNEGKTRGTGNVVTGETLENNRTAIHVLDKSRVTSIATDVIDSISGNVITAAAHSARAGDLVRITSGAASGVEFRVFATDTNTITLEADNPTLAPSASDTFAILRPITQTLSSTGGVTAENTFIRDGASQVVTEDTVTPANNRPLPVKLTDFSGDMVLNASNLNLEVQTSHVGANADSLRIGDGTETVNVNASNEMQVADDTARTSLSTIAGDTTSLDAKLPSQGAALTAASTPVNIASDQTVPVSAASLPLPTGAATEATLATIDTDTGVIAGDTTSIDGKTPSLGAAVIASSVPVNIASDQTVPVSASSLPLPSGAATEATLSTLNAKFVTGTDIGDVTINNASAGSAVNIQDGGNSITIDNSVLTNLDATISGSEVQVDVVGALPAGGNTIGAVTIGALSVVDLIDDLGDGAGIIFLANDSIDDNAGTFLTIVASTAAEIKKVEIRSTAGGFVGLFTGPGASEVLLTTFGPGEDMTLELGAVVSTTRLSLRRMDSTTVPLTTGFITMNFLG